MEVQLFGNVGKDAEVKMIGDKEQVSFTVADTEKKKGETVTNWVSCLYGNKNVAPYLKKGQKVYVRGLLLCNIFKTKDGESKVGYTVFVNKLALLGGQPQSEQPAKGFNNSTPQSYVGDIEPNTGDLPFS